MHIPVKTFYFKKIIDGQFRFHKYWKNNEWQFISFRIAIGSIGEICSINKQF